MNRRKFLQQCTRSGAGLAALLMTGLVTHRVAAGRHARQRLQSHVVGAPYRIGFETPVETVFFPGQTLRAVWEPDNHYDRHAIALYDGNEHVGYLPRRHARFVIDAMVEARPAAVKVVDVAADDPWEGIGITVEWDE